jgi:hypothetical protein
MSLGEAPASANCYVTLGGRQVQVTLRDTDEGRLLQRLEALLQRFPQGEEPGEPGAGWCEKHHRTMKLHQNEKGTWYSHPLGGGRYCHGR